MRGLSLASHKRPELKSSRVVGGIFRRQWQTFKTNARQRPRRRAAVCVVEPSGTLRRFRWTPESVNVFSPGLDMTAAASCIGWVWSACALNLGWAPRFGHSGSDGRTLNLCSPLRGAAQRPPRELSALLLAAADVRVTGLAAACGRPAAHAFEGDRVFPFSSVSSSLPPPGLGPIN